MVVISNDNIDVIFYVGCPLDQVLLNSNSPLPSCRNRNPAHPVMELGCVCPIGKIINERTGRCIHPEDCPRCVCSASGDPHYLTYDGHRYDLFDKCSHIFTKDCAENTFTVFSITSNRCSGGRVPTCIDQAVVEIPSLTVTVNLFTNPSSYTINGIFPNPSKLNIVFNHDKIVLEIVDLGVRVTLGTYYLTVGVPSSYSGKLCGLAGDCNSISSDDFKFKNGTVTTDVWALEKEYRAPHIKSDCSYPQSRIEPPLCDSEEQARGREFCSYLTSTSGSYSLCHDVISPNPSFDNCVTDYCFRDDEWSTVCRVIQDYAHECRLNGITVGPPPSECGA